MKTYVGIDPGQKGGIAVISASGEVLEVYRMPEFPCNIASIFEGIIKSYDNPFVVMEKSQSMPKQGIAGAHSYGIHNGVLLGMIIMGKLPYHLVRPVMWKKLILAGEADKSDKNTSIRICENLFPDVDLIPGQLRKPHDGIAEALLIAEYGRRTNL